MSSLCNLYGFLMKNDLPSFLLKLQNQQASSSSLSIKLAIPFIVQFFGFENIENFNAKV